VRVFYRESMPCRVFVDSYAGADTGGPEALVQIALAFFAIGLDVGIIPEPVIAPHFKEEYPEFVMLPHRSLETAGPNDVYFAPEQRPCGYHGGSRMYIWLLARAQRPPPPCRGVAHNMEAHVDYRLPFVQPYITPSTMRMCELSFHSRQQRDLILIDSDTPKDVVDAVTSVWKQRAVFVSGFARKDVLAMLRRAAYVIDWQFVGSERVPIEAVLCGAELLTSSLPPNAALYNDFSLSRTVKNISELMGALRQPPKRSRVSHMRKRFSMLNASTMAEEVRTLNVCGIP